MIALDLIGNRPQGAKNYASELFKKAEESIPKGISVSAAKLEPALNKLEKSLTAGGKQSTTPKALEKIQEIRSEIKNGKISLERLIPFRRSINDAIESIGGWESEVPKKFKPLAKRNLNSVKSEVIDALNEYGSKFNPEFKKYHNAANEAWAAYEQSNKISKFLKHLGYSSKSPVIQSLFGLGGSALGIGTLIKSPVTFGMGVTGALGYQGYKILNRIQNSPTLREYYLDVLKNASKRNAPATIRSLRQLEDRLED